MKSLLRMVALVAGLAAAAAYAGGPLQVCSSGVPLKYPGSGLVTLNYDGGGVLGARSKAQADAIVTNAVSLWTNVNTATVTLARGADLAGDVTVANVSAYMDNFSDGLNPVIYDTDGSIVDALLGTGQKSYVLGFAGSAYSLSPCQYVEGRAVINGSIAVTDSSMTVVIAHEVGHLIGLDHTQLDGAQGLTTSNYPLMYPIAYRSLISLHDDDISAVSSLYPDTTFNSVYGQVSGNLRASGGVTPVLGANVWAQEVTTHKVYSVVSDYLMQGNGYFKLSLPAGTYTLHAEAIDSQFTGGSGVGPYSDTYPTSASFQPPLYSGSTPMAPVTLGGGIPLQFSIVPGCAATATFALSGVGSVSGNCVTKVNPTVSLSSSVNPSLGGQNVSFTASLSGSAGIPTGTVNFRDGGSSIGGCSAISLTAGTAACTTAALTAGSHSITAVYSGDGAYNAATSAAVSQSVLAAPGQPVNVSVVAGPGLVTVSFLPPDSGDTSSITSYTATCTATGQATATATGTTSPIVVRGLVAGVAYGCSVTATNATGTGAASAAVLVTPLPNTDILTLLLLLLE